MKTWLLAGALSLAAAGMGFAQSYGVPSELLNNTRRLAGDKLEICSDVTGKIRDFDRAVAVAIADSLFLKPEFHEGFGGYPTSGDGFLDELLIAMTNSCDIMMGMTVQENSPFPDWAMMSRPYVSLPYLFVVKDDYKSLTDIPRSRKLGTPLSSMGERVFITWNQQLPKDKRFIRLPYADMDLMTKRVADGSTAGMVIWAPVFAQLQKTNPDAKDLHAISMVPVPATVTRVGILIKVRDTYLRTQIDEAIDALVADGTIQRLMDEFGYEGTPGDAKGVQ